MHDKLKEQFPSFPKVDPKTVYNFVMMIRNENGIPKVSCSERQYSAVPDLPPGEQAQVDFGEKKLRTSTGIWVKVYFFIMLLCYKMCIRDRLYTVLGSTLGKEGNCSLSLSCMTADGVSSYLDK